MVDKEKVEQAIRLLLEGIGEDTEREGLKDTPDRIARMCMEIYGGLDEEADHHLAKQFQVENNEMVLEKDITFYSMCEHHLMPFYGKAAIAYIQGYRFKQARPYSRCLCQKTTDPGTSYSTDCRCSGTYPESQGNHGYAGSRAYLHDHAWYQKTGQ